MNEKAILREEGSRLNCLGDYQLIKLTGKDTNGQFAAIYLDNPPHTLVPLHVHEDEVYKVIEGEVEFSVGGEELGNLSAESPNPLQVAAICGRYNVKFV